MKSQNLQNSSTLSQLHAFYILTALLVISFLVKLGYVYFYTDYTHYLFSDMGEYWKRALYSFNHGDKVDGQWAIWPPFAHITLAWFFKLTHVLGVFEQKLELAIAMNVLLSTLSVLWIYLIALKLYPSRAYALTASTIYAFFFPLIYFNAFILSEHLSLFMLLLSIVIVLYAHTHWLNYFITGAILSFAIGMRPSFGVIGLPFFIYILFQKKRLKNARFGYALLFSLGYLFFLLFIIINNYSNSDGKVGLSANGGLNFYLSACQKQGIVTRYGSSSWYVFPPSSSGKPELGVTYESEPFYHQAHYYQLGKSCIASKNAPSLQEKFSRYHYLFNDSMFPALTSAKFFKEGMPLFSNIALYMTFILLLFPLLFFDRLISKSTVLFLGMIAFVQLFVLFFFNIEQRYLYGFFFIIDLLSTLILFSIWNQLCKSSKLGCSVLLLMILPIILFPWYTTMHPTKVAPTMQISMHIYKDKNNLYKIEQNRNTIKALDTEITTINFKTTHGLVHETMGTFDFDTNIFIDFNTSMYVLQEGNYTFIIVSDDGFQLNIDQNPIAVYPKGRAAGLNQVRHSLPKGKHQFDLSYFQGRGLIAIRAYYEIAGKRFHIGEDSEYIHFRLTDQSIYRSPKVISSESAPQNR